MNLESLIKALQIFLKYGNPAYPTRCVDEMLIIKEVDPSMVSDQDKKELAELGFEITDQWDDGTFVSYYYGS
jgi:hypothetical protein